MGVDVLTICNVCTLNLRRANKMVKEDARLLEQVNEELVKAGARPYEGTKEVTHLLWYLATEEGLSLLEKQGPRGLNGLRVAPYYGCQLLRPSSVMGFEDPDRPQSLERLITALGGEVADYEAKSKCCGFPIILAREEVALKESHVALSQSRDAGRRLHGHALPALPPGDGRLPAQGRGGQRRPSTTCRCCTCRSSSAWRSASTPRSWTSSATWSRWTACWRRWGPRDSAVTWGLAWFSMTPPTAGSASR